MAAERTIAWTHDVSLAPALARFFVSNVGSTYISAGEVTDGRALDFAHWVPDLEAGMEGELVAALSGTVPVRVATVLRGDVVVGVALVHWVADARVPHAVLDDVVVGATERGQGTGHTLVEFIEAEARLAGLQTLFLESGLGNTRAHAFFERCGFRPCSIQMAKRL